MAQLKSAYDKKLAGYRDRIDQLSSEVDNEKVKNEALQQDLTSLQTRANEAIAVREALGKRINELQSIIDSTHKRHNDEIAEKDKLINRIKVSFKQKEEEFDELMDVKIALAMEIKQYRILLENEEERLGYSSPNKKSKVDQLLKSSSHDPTAQLVITAMDLEGQFIVIRNSTTDMISLDGWTLRTRESKEEFKFPSNLSLKPADSVTVWIGGVYAEKENHPIDFVWPIDELWHREGDAVMLLHPDGQIVSKVDVMPKH